MTLASFQSAQCRIYGGIHLHQADFESVQLFDERTSELMIVAQHGLDANLLRRFSRIAAIHDRYLSGRAACSRAPVIINDAFAAGQYRFVGESAAAAGYRVVRATPMITSEGRLVGVLATHFAQPDACARLDMLMTQFYARLAANVAGAAHAATRHGLSLERPGRAA